MGFVEKLSNIVRSVSLNNEQNNQGRSSQTTPTPWDSQTARDRDRDRDRERERERERERPRSRESHRQRDSKDSREYNQPSQNNREQYFQRDSKDSSQRDRIERYGSRSHGRNASSGTGGATSTAEYADGRRHDYDLQAMEADLSSPRTTHPKRPIPSPIVTVRSEYPSLTRSKLSQTLTCLITIEVPGGKWSPDAQDLRLPAIPNPTQEKEVVSPKLPPPREEPVHDAESTEELDEVTEDLRARVENWHGLDFSRSVDSPSLSFLSIC